MLMSSKPLLSKCRYWLLRATFMWAMVYLPSAYADCEWKLDSVTGFEEKVWAEPKLRTKPNWLKLEPLAITINVKFWNCTTNGWFYEIGPVMNTFRGEKVFKETSGIMGNGVFYGTYKSSNSISIESTASFINRSPPRCLLTVEEIPFDPIGFRNFTAGIKVSKGNISSCSSFTYTVKIVVVQTADLVYPGGSYCPDPYTTNECLMVPYMNVTLWNGIKDSKWGNTYAIPFVPAGKTLWVWAKFPPIPSPTPPPVKKCDVVIKSSVKRR